MDDLTTVPSRPAALIPVHGNHLLACLAPRDREMLMPDLERVKLDREQPLANPGAGMPWVHFPEDTTMVTLSTPLTDGRAAMTGAITRHGAIGLLEAMGDGVSFVRAAVVLPGPAMRISAPKLAAAARRSPGLRGLIGNYSQQLAGEVMQLAACNALHSVRHRVCRWILTAHDCVHDGAGTIEAEATPLPLTQEMLGDALGVQRTTITVVAMQLQQAGLVRYGRGKVFVLDRPGLEAAACECHNTIRQRRKRSLAQSVAA